MRGVMISKISLRLVLLVSAFVAPGVHADTAVENPFLAIYSEKSPVLTWANGDGRLEIGFLNKSEGIYSKNLSYLSGSVYDQTLYFQDTSDFKFYAKHGEALRGRMVVRNKFRVAEPESIGRISDSTVKIGDAPSEGSHSHYVGKLFLWIREAWLDVCLNKALGLKMDSQHYFKFGLFPFSVGRGISLGDAYLTSPGAVGFFSSNVIDQFAFGTLFHGEMGTKALEYDVYFALLRNASGSYKDVTAKTFERDFTRANPYRGFGQLNVLLATRLIGTIKNPLCTPGSLRLEPYAVFNHDPEQKIEFEADAASKFATVGFATEYEGEKYSWGIEGAVNLGHQDVRAWDRNEIKLVNRDGAAVFEYTKVYQGDPSVSGTKKALVTSANKTAVANGGAGQNLNGQEIGNSGLYNAVDRFTNAYTNKYKGAMFVGDFIANVRKNVKIATSVAYASGDVNPNRDQLNMGDSNMDGDYQGFIPFQSNYSGRSVASLFFLGTGRIVRPLNTAPTPSERDSFADVTSGFTNIILYGVGSDMLVNVYGRKSRLRPNILFGWQAITTNGFDAVLKKTTDKPADRYLGFEANFFGEIEFMKNLKGFLVTGIFFPGGHFKDIKGKPVTSDQVDLLSKKNVCSDDLFDPNNLPLVNNKKAFIINLGLEYSF